MKIWFLMGMALASALKASPAPVDTFGVNELFSSRAKGVEYFSTSWKNGHARSFKDSADPEDPWFDAGHGSGSYSIDGRGALTADGDIVRMYVHNPDRKTEWAENLEITAYITRLSEKKRVSYSGPQIFARTNHGTFTASFGSESKTLCDDRGLGAKINLDGAWAFEKETCHGADKGYATAGFTRFWPSGFPVNTPVGVKYVLRNIGSSQVQLRLYVDMSGGKNGGDWKLVSEYDDRQNFGRGATPCREGVNPALVHTRDNLLENSETGKPELSVYFRHEYAVMRYEKLSVREIEALPALKP